MSKNDEADTAKVDAVRIAGVMWQVAQVSSGELFERSGEDLLGQCCYSECVIRLRHDMPVDRSATVLLHEIMHVIADDAGLDLPEGALRKLSTGMFEVLAHNRGLYDMVFHDAQISEKERVADLLHQAQV